MWAPMDRHARLFIYLLFFFFFDVKILTLQNRENKLLHTCRCICWGIYQNSPFDIQRWPSKRQTSSARAPLANRLIIFEKNAKRKQKKEETPFFF